MTLANLIAVLVIAIPAVVLGLAAKRIGIPDFLGFILAGAAIGVVTSRMVPLDGMDQVFLNKVANLGLISLMVTTGFGMSAHIGVRSWKEVAILSSGIVVCLLPAFMTAHLLMEYWPDPVLIDGPASVLAYRRALALAVIVTSVPFITKVLAHNGLLRTPFAATVLCTACAVDLVVWALVPAVIASKIGGSMGVGTALTHVLGTVVLLTGAVIIVHFLTRPAVVQNNAVRSRLPDPHIIGVLLLAALSFCFVAFVGVSVMVGALVFGLALGRLSLPEMRYGRWLERGASLLLVPLYFAIVGMRLRLGLDVQFGFIAVFLAWSTVIKTTIVICVAASLRYRVREVLAFGFALNTRGGPGIVLATVTFGAGVIGEPTFIAFISASIATAMLANWVLQATIAERPGAPNTILGGSMAHRARAVVPPN